MANVDLPSRLFADREEPAGDRVNMYFKLNTIKAVLKALTPEELDTIRPCFGKLLDIYSKPVFSGKLAHFLLTRQLNVVKRHEIWVIFAGKPIRFSLREFGLVTGLNCSPLPPLDRSLLKSPPGVTPYWFTLFGGEEYFTGEMLLAKLRRPKALSPELRVKYACLLLVDGFLSRRSYHMKIPKSHVEMIRDLDAFLAYPWGRYSFDLTMRCIKSRSLDQLAQATVAIQGFIHALVLVFVEAVPAVLSAVGAGTDPESGDEDPFPVIAMKLEPVWDLDGVDEVEVLSVLPVGENVVGIEDCSWPDEVSDPSVDLMLQQLDDGVKFKRAMFGGGIRGADVQVEPPPRVIVKRKRKLRAKASECSTSRGDSSRAKKSKVRAARARFASQDSPRDVLDTATALKAALKEAQSDVYAHICVELKSMELRLERSLKDNINSAVAAAISGSVVENVLRDVGIGVGQPYNKSPSSESPSLRQTDPQPSPVVAASGNHSDQCQRPSQLQPPIVKEQNAGPVVQGAANSSIVEGTFPSESSGSRSRSPADEVNEEASNGGDCGQGQIVARDEAVAMSAKYKMLMVSDIPPMSFGDGLVIKDSELLMIPTIIPPGYPNVMDACVSVLRETLFDNTDPASDPRADLLPCKFYGSLAVMYAKFKKVKRKETFEFDPALINEISTRCKATGRVWLSHIEHLLSPFNIDKNRWIAVHIDLTSHTLTVLDPTAAARRGSRLKPELEFICEMFPYLVRKVGGCDLMKNFPLQPLTFARNTHVSQATNLANSGMLSLLLLEAYATGGMDKAVLVNEDGMRLRAEELAVQMYEHCLGEI